MFLIVINTYLLLKNHKRKFIMKKFHLLILFTLAFIQLNLAQTGFKLDNTFGVKGHTVFGQEDVDLFTNSFLQFKLNEGYIMAGGYEDNVLLETGFIFVRYDNKGKIDTTFGERGVLKYPVVDVPFESIANIRDAADKSCLVLLRGTNEMDNDTSGIVCFTSKGKWVTDFGDGGTVFSKNGIIQDFDILDDGKILTLINTGDGIPTSSFERYTQLGFLDKSYGKDGVAKFNTGFQVFNKMDRSGTSYLCTGIEVDITTFNFSLCSAKVSASGAKAFNYGTLGIGKTAPSPKEGLTFPFKSKPLADGSLLLIGVNVPDDTTGTEPVSYFLTKINPNGTANTTFGKDGYLEIIVEEATQIFGIDFIELPNKKILMSKAVFDAAQEALINTLELFGAEGKVETKFGTDGIAIFNVNDEYFATFNINLRTDGKIALGGLLFNSTTELGEGFISVIELTYPINTADNTNNINTLSLFPNPVKDNVVLKYDLNEESNVSVDLYDLSGKMIQQLLPAQKRSVGAQQENFVIDANLASGQYLLRMNMGDKGAKTIKVNKI